MRRGPTPRRVWQPMLPATPVPLTAAEQLAMGDQQIPEMWKNDRYTAIVNRHSVDRSVMHISFRRNDRKAVHDWRDIQRIKNDIAGEETEALELYPAESRLVDESNQYHLWCFPPGERIPIGYNEGRVVQYEPIPVPGSRARQRPA